jgi:hypothetical protein
MQQLYTQEQLVSFGNYLLNTHRVKDAMEYAKAGTDGELDTEFITQVYDADLANWSALAGLKYTADNSNAENEYTWYMMPSESKVVEGVTTRTAGNAGFATIQDEHKG